MKLNLEDSYRFLHPNVKKYTYSNSTGTSQSRIDYIFVSKYMNGQVKKVNIKHIPKIPDHKAVEITLAMKYDRGTGYWKLNVNYLEDIILLRL